MGGVLNVSARLINIFCHINCVIRISHNQLIIAEISFTETSLNRVKAILK